MAQSSNAAGAATTGDPVRPGIEADSPKRTNEDSIRERAHAIWEEHGRPDGSHEAHWHQAERELTDRQLSAGDPSPAGP